MATLLDTPRVPPLELKDWSPELKNAMWFPKDAQNREDLPEMISKVFNVTATMANHPILAKNWNHFAMHIMGTNSLSPRLREIAIMRIGYLCQSDYELSQHAWISQFAGITEGEISNLIEGAEAPGWSPLESAVIQAADELKESNIISDATWYELEKEGLSVQQRMDLIFTIGQYNLVSWALNSLGVQLDEGLDSFLDVRHTTVGC
ncbi:MAG TPA: carboxymuconolactone decarboxylase family protein [Gammaproteobacteria bacterium]|nr:carboxymuconolactone decarboxylase family protein [Gammaproteobacteria bacterium]